MPGTPHELATLAAEWPEDSLIPPPGHRWADGTEITPDEWGDLLALRAYLYRLRRAERMRPAQRKARRLLRRLLSAEQRRQLRRLRYFYATTPGGNTYRLDPRRGYTERVERHGRRWFVKASYCLHDEPDDGKMPPADVTTGHLLLLLSDEETFLMTANETDRRDQLWNGDYLRRMRRRHRPDPAETSRGPS